MIIHISGGYVLPRNLLLLFLYFLELFASYSVIDSADIYEVIRLLDSSFVLDAVRTPHVQHRATLWEFIGNKAYSCEDYIMPFAMCPARDKGPKCVRMRIIMKSQVYVSSPTVLTFDFSECHLFHPHTYKVQVYLKFVSLQEE